MPRTCTICTHQNRIDIEKSLVDGQSLRSIADRYTISKTALVRHKSDHFPRSLAESLPIEPVPVHPAKRTAEPVQAYVAERHQDSHEHAIDVVRTTAEQVRRLELLSNAVDAWLRDPDATETYSLAPRAEEIDVIYLDYRDLDDGQRPQRRKESLDELLERVETGNYQVVSLKTRHADPRELLAKVAESLKGQMQLSMQLLDKLYGAEQVELFQHMVLDAIAEVDPDVRGRIEDAIRRRQLALRATGPTLS